AEHLDLVRGAQRQQDSHRIVLSGVGVDNDLATHVLGPAGDSGARMIGRGRKERNTRFGDCFARRYQLASRVLDRQRAVPKSMSGIQFDRVTTLSSRFALIVLGILAVIVALSLGRVILAPITLAIVVGLMFGPVADLLERRGIPSALSAGLVVILLIGVLLIGGALFAAPLSQWIE